MAGYRVGRAIRDTVADTVVSVRQGLMRHETAEKARATNALMDHWEAQLREELGPMADLILANEAIPEAVRSLLSSVGSPQHAMDFIKQIIFLFASLPSLVGAAGAGFASDVRRQAYRAVPRNPADVSSIVSGMATQRIPQGVGRDEALSSGYDSEALDLMVRASQSPLSPGEVITLIRKDKASTHELTQSAIQSGIHPDWIPGLRELIWGMPSAGIMTSARVQGHVGEGEQKAALREDGIDPAWSEVMYQTAGRPPGIQELLHLMNRGLITEGTVRQAIAESDVKTKYSDAIIQMAVYLPPPRSIVPMLRSGSITVDRARHLFMQHGLSAEDAEAFIREATHGKTESAKHATASLILSMYEDYEMDRATAERLLRNLNHDDENIVLELGRADALRGKKLRDAATSRVRAQYDKRHIDRQTASNLLDRAGVLPQARDQMLATWDIERQVSAPSLTTAQLGTAYKRGAIDEAQLKARLEGLGWNAADVDILMIIYGAE